jgi:hypothetical protein
MSACRERQRFAACGLAGYVVRASTITMAGE